jgi:hypothetical protein
LSNKTGPGQKSREFLEMTTAVAIIPFIIPPKSEEGVIVHRAQILRQVQKRSGDAAAMTVVERRESEITYAYREQLFLSS